ncbi:MAG: thiamine phosphate synthase [Clostridia bacterium]|nr:thiamine phosphate synthase [Clostridia bacterium]
MRISADELRLYAVTDRSWLGGETIFDQVEKAVRGGATCVQLREKALGHEDFLAEAKEMAKLCRRLGVKLIINDNVDVALESGADGVHVGQDDMQAMDVRRRIGPDRILGVTAKTVEQARAAEAAGADYLGSGAVFGSATKTDAKPMTMDTLRSICASVGIPVVGIGGVNRDNIARLAGTGVAGAAVVSGIFAARDIEAECRLLRGMAEEIIR